MRPDTPFWCTSYSSAARFWRSVDCCAVTRDVYGAIRSLVLICVRGTSPCLRGTDVGACGISLPLPLSLIHISEPTRPRLI
eukprot:1891631-Rhodomonas_salina.2